MQNQIQDRPEQASQTSQIVNREGRVEQGYGACSASGCNCQSYEGSANTCSNCGHNFGTHW